MQLIDVLCMNAWQAVLNIKQFFGVSFLICNATGIIIINVWYRKSNDVQSDRI